MSVLAQTMPPATQSTGIGDALVGFLFVVAFLSWFIGSNLKAEDLRAKKWRKELKKQRWRYFYVCISVFLASSLAVVTLFFEIDPVSFSWNQVITVIFGSTASYLSIAVMFALFRIGFRGTFRIRVFTTYFPMAVWACVIVVSLLRLTPLHWALNWLIGLAIGAGAFLGGVKLLPTHDKLWAESGLKDYNNPTPLTPVYQIGVYDIRLYDISPKNKRR